MRLTKQQFIDRFSQGEMQGILTAAKVSTAVESWLFRFNNLTPDLDGTSVDLSDPRTVTGLYSLEEAGILGEGRASEILGVVMSFAGINLYDKVKFKHPFSVIFPDGSTVVGFLPEANSVITEVGSFDLSNLEVE